MPPNVGAMVGQMCGAGFQPAVISNTRRWSPKTVSGKALAAHNSGTSGRPPLIGFTYTDIPQTRKLLPSRSTSYIERAMRLQILISSLAIWLVAVSSATFGQFGLVTAQRVKNVAGSANLADVTIQPGDVEPHIRFLAGSKLQGRSGADALKAAQYIQTHYKSLGLKPLFGDDYLQTIPGRTNDQGETQTAGQNVGGWIQGSDPTVADEFIIVSAHYDHLGKRNGVIYAGADDNASGVSMVLELARQIAKSPVKPRRSIAFVNFDLEEKMLWGSRWFASHMPMPTEKVRLFITADMIGRSLGNLPLPMVFVMGAEHGVGLKDSMNKIELPEGLEVARLGVDLIGVRSDYGPFMERKIPFLFFSTGEHPDYHSPRDVPDRIDYNKVAMISTLIHNVTRMAADSTEPPTWTSKVTLDLDEATGLKRVTQLMLQAEADDKYKLSDLQRMLVSHVNSRSTLILERGRMTQADRTWLTRSAKLLLLSVF